MSPGTFTGYKFICTKCDEIVYGEEPPQECVQCKARDTYVQVEESDEKEVE